MIIKEPSNEPEPIYIDAVYWIHKHSVALHYGGPEEGGWWFDTGVPTGFSFGPIVGEDAAYDQARKMNELEHERREREEDYDYSSVLSYKSDHFSYSVEDYPVPVPYPEFRPHYE